MYVSIYEMKYWKTDETKTICNFGYGNYKFINSKSNGLFALTK